MRQQNGRLAEQRVAESLKSWQDGFGVGVTWGGGWVEGGWGWGELGDRSLDFNFLVEIELGFQ